MAEEKAILEVLGGTRTLVSGISEKLAQANGEQVSLFDDLCIPDEPIFEAGGADLPQQRKAGRPVGARNRTTQAVASYIQKTQGDPLLALCALSRALEPENLLKNMRELATKSGLPLGASVYEITKLSISARLQALSAVVPYVHAKPIPTTKNGDEVLPVMIMAGAMKQPLSGYVDGGDINLEDYLDMPDDNAAYAATIEGLADVQGLREESEQNQ